MQSSHCKKPRITFSWNRLENHGNFNQLNLACVDSLMTMEASDNWNERKEQINSFVTEKELCRWTHSFGIAGTKKVVGDWLEVSLVAVLVPPNGQTGLSLRRRLFSTVVRSTPSDNCRSSSDKSLFGRLRLRQANWYHILRLPHRLFQNHNCESI